MADTEDVNSLKRRSRRRLVGAIALVLLAVIVLPMVFDAEPKRALPPVSVRIPGEDETGFTPKVTPKAPPAAAEAPKPEAPKPLAAAPEKPESVAEKAPAKAPAKTPQKVAAKAPEKFAAGAPQKPAAIAPEKPAAAPADARFIVPIAALANPDKVRELTETLKTARLPYYTEPIATAKGPVTRVRAGPFASRDAAEKALQQLKDLGLKPGNVTTRG